MKKKAAIQLSINAIIIIIIAIVMLALGLGFVRMLFGGATDKFAALIAQEQDPPPAGSADVVTVSRTMVLTRPGKAEVIKVSVYNPTGTAWGEGDFDPDPAGCEGAVTSDLCDQLTPLGDVVCPTVLNCVWHPVALQCMGSIVDPCDGFTEDVCDVVAGCTWEGGEADDGEVATLTINCNNIATFLTDFNPDDDGDPDTHDDESYFQTNSKAIGAGTAGTFDVLFEIETGADVVGSYLCQITVKSFQEDFVIKVQ